MDYYTCKDKLFLEKLYFLPPVAVLILPTRKKLRPSSPSNPCSARKPARMSFDLAAIMKKIDVHRDEIVARYKAAIMADIQKATSYSGLLLVGPNDVASIGSDNYWFLEGLSNAVDDLKSETHFVSITLVTKGAEKYIQWSIEAN